VRILVKIQPRASKEQVLHNPDGTLKVYLKAAPTDGKANKALIEILAGYYSVKRSNIRIITGKLSRNKIIEVIGGESGTP